MVETSKYFSQYHACMYMYIICHIHSTTKYIIPYYGVDYDADFHVHTNKTSMSFSFVRIYWCLFIRLQCTNVRTNHLISFNVGVEWSFYFLISFIASTININQLDPNWGEWSDKYKWRYWLWMSRAEFEN